MIYAPLKAGCMWNSHPWMRIPHTAAATRESASAAILAAGGQWRAPRIRPRFIREIVNLLPPRVSGDTCTVGE